ncbi:MAG: hypothetical protein FWG06_03985 [Clostridiales bacterium]|nr:hypothetical protein [Clostridiales bacterium]
MPPLLIGLLSMAGYGLFLLVRALPRLYRAGEKKLVYCVMGFVLITPLPVWLVSSMPREHLSLWLALPALILFGIWLCLGYFVESYRKKMEQNTGKEPAKRPSPPPGLLRRNVLILAAGLIIWCYGAFVGIDNSRAETALLCVCLLLLTASLGSLWRYRKF